MIGQFSTIFEDIQRGDTVDFLFRAKRASVAAWAFFKCVIGLHGLPDKIAINRSGANTAAVVSLQDAV